MSAYGPLSAKAKSSRAGPSAYLRQSGFCWEQYCDNLKECVMLSTIRYAVGFNFGVLTNRPGLLPPPTPFFFPMEIPGYPLTRTQVGSLCSGVLIMEEESPPQAHVSKLNCVATLQEVHDSSDAVNTLRCSQPARLSGKNTKHQPLA